jgi:acyl-CoA thioesterase-1
VVPVDAPILVSFGDSLTAGYGLAPEESYPSVLQNLLAERGTPYRVINEGVSGDTTATALARVDVAATHEAVLAIVAIGANDGLRGLPVEEMEANLREIVRRFQVAGRRVALAGMRIPPNMGPEYVGQFEAIYARVAEDMNIPLLPFLLEGVAADPDLNQDDGIHPNRRGARIVAHSVASFVETLLSEAEMAAE